MLDQEQERVENARRQRGPAIFGGVIKRLAGDVESEVAELEDADALRNVHHEAFARFQNNSENIQNPPRIRRVRERILAGDALQPQCKPE